MARTSNPSERIRALLEAGESIFRHHDFKRAQMSDIASEMGCSTGTLYNYVENKEALFEQVVLFGMTGDLPSADDLPLQLPNPGTTFTTIERRARELAEGWSIYQALDLDAPASAVEEVERMTNELFDFFARYYRVIEVMETSVLDYADLASTYDSGRQQMIFRPWTALIEKRGARGIYRPIKDPEWVTILIVEALAAGAWKQRTKDKGYDETRARRACLDFVLCALLEDKDR